MSRSLRIAGLIGPAGLGATIGYLGWSSFHSPLPLLMLPVVCISLSDARQVFGLLLGYMATATRLLMAGAMSFGETHLDVALNLAGWGFLCVSVALMWTIPHMATRSQVGRSIGLATVQGALLVPPLWLLGVAHPISAWGFVVPGAGWVGVGLALAVPQVAGMLLKEATQSRETLRAVAMVIGLCVLVLLSERRQPELLHIDGLVAVGTAWGSPTQKDHPAVDRLPEVAKLIESARPLAPEIVAFPESTLGVASEATDFLIRLELRQALRSTSSQVLLPMDRADGRPRTSALLMNPDGSQRWLDARQPMPMALWRPWDEGSYSADWDRDNSIKLQSGRRAWISFCYEDVMPGFTLAAILKHHPDVLISIANNWFISGAEGTDIQANAIESLALLFGVPIVRAVNRAVPTSK